ncbi:MAG: hypothetical protein U9P11_06120, partial [Pseudomonadota bacterium]|nr:hypothetical protein [Pseudomonadota bacterium]
GKIVHTCARLLRKMIAASDKLAGQQAPQILAAAREQSTRTLAEEINRLQALARINPNVRAEEIRFLELQREALTAALESTSLRLDALRVIVVT